jgi:hypothetical protein
MSQSSFRLTALHRAQSGTNSTDPQSWNLMMPKFHNEFVKPDTQFSTEPKKS